MTESNVFDFMNSDYFKIWSDNLPIGVCVIDAQYTVLHWNTACEKLHKEKREKLLGRKLSEAMPGALLPSVVDSMGKGNSKELFYSEGYNVVMTVCPVRDSDGTLVGCISFEQDISAYQKVSEMLKEAKHSIRLLKKEMNSYMEDEYSFEKMVGEDPAFLQQKELCKAFAQTRATVLLEGESGTGKEVFARAIHAESKRKGPFLALNCSAVPAALFESELFGYEKGTFTGGDRNGKIGLIEAANGGTLFLDEIGEMPMETQPKLLRVLESGTVTRVGGIREKTLDVRIICATNRSLKRLADEGRFRLDLYYRLNTLSMEMIPLRERKADIAILAKYFLESYCQMYNVKIPELNARVIEALKSGRWEGNVRELKNTMERLVIQLKYDGNIEITPGYLGDEKIKKEKLFEPPYPQGKALSDLLAETEKTVIESAMRQTCGSVTKAAELLQIPRTSLYYKLGKYGISVEKEIVVEK